MDNHSVNGRRCEAIKPGGEPCEAHAMKNSTFCFFHEPGKAEERAAARQAGGLERSRRVGVLPADTPDRPLRSKREVADLLRDTINQIRRGQIDPKVGHIIGYLATLYMKFLQEAESLENLWRYHDAKEERLAIEERNREKRRAALETIVTPKPIEPFAVPKVTPVDSTDESREEPEAHVLPAEKKQEFVFVTAEANSGTIEGEGKIVGKEGGEQEEEERSAPEGQADGGDRSR